MKNIYIYIYMSKLGYDETNFTNAIADLGRCENETKDLNRQILVLKDNIKDLKTYKVEIENILHNYRINNSDKRRIIELLDKVQYDKESAIEQLSKPLKIGNTLISNTLPSYYQTQLEKSKDELNEFRDAPATIRRGLPGGGKKYKKNRTKRIKKNKNKKNKSRKHK